MHMPADIHSASNLSVPFAPVRVTLKKLLKIDAERACSRDEADQCLCHPEESVRDTLQKPACPPVDPKVQLGSMIYVAAPTSPHSARHMAGEDTEGHGSGQNEGDGTGGVGY